MEALILSCSTGGGHNTAAQAVFEALTERGHHAVRMDPYTLVSEELANKVGQTYIKLVQKSPKLFGAVYDLGNAYRKLPGRSPVYHINGKMAAVHAEIPCGTPNGRDRLHAFVPGGDFDAHAAKRHGNAAVCVYCDGLHLRSVYGGIGLRLVRDALPAFEQRFHRARHSCEKIAAAGHPGAAGFFR